MTPFQIEPREPAQEKEPLASRFLKREPPASVAYVVATAITGIALLIAKALVPDVPEPNYLPFIAAVAVSTWYGGLGAGMVASVLSIFAIDFSFLPPIGKIEFTHSEEVVETIVFVVVALLISATTTALRRARALAEQRAYELAASNAALERQMEEVKALSERLQRTREDVLRTVAHDLRNPLHLLVTSTEMLAELELPRERREMIVEITKRAATQMNRLLSDLLDSAQIHAGRLSLQLDSVPLGVLIERAAESARPLADEKGITLDVRVADAMARTRADEVRVQQVLGNLVGNALKFTPSGGHITIDACAKDGWAIVRVTDNGPGIAREQLPKLFEQFWQQRSGDRRGVGLGLGIARGIIEAHGGTIDVTSTLGRGTSFVFTLPLATTAPHEVERPLVLQAEANGAAPAASEQRLTSPSSRGEQRADQ